MTDRGTIGVRVEAWRRADRVDVAFHLEIPAGSHIEPHVPADPFFIPTVVDFEDLEVESITYPDPVEKDLGIPGSALLVYEGDVIITARVRADEDHRVASGTIRFQPCVGGACLPPRSQSWTTSILESVRVANAP